MNHAVFWVMTSDRKPRPKARQHVICGASEPHYADVHASVYAAHKRIQQNARKSRCDGMGLSEQVWGLDELVGLPTQ